MRLPHGFPGQLHTFSELSQDVRAGLEERVQRDYCIILHEAGLNQLGPHGARSIEHSLRLGRRHLLGLHAQSEEGMVDGRLNDPVVNHTMELQKRHDPLLEFEWKPINHTNLLIFVR